jgi:hypothetical protein
MRVRRSVRRVCQKCGCDLTTKPGRPPKLCEGCRAEEEASRPRRQRAGPATCHPERKRYSADGRCQSCYTKDKYRSDAEFRLRQIEYSKRRYAASKKPTSPRTCHTCGVEYTPKTRHPRNRYCSDACRRSSPKERARLRQKAKEKWRRKRSGRESGGGYVDQEVFERDGWRCGLCRKRIGRSYSYPHPRSASIDHIVPLSRGGEDIARNVQAAHLACNLDKGNRGEPEQLLLVG